MAAADEVFTEWVNERNNEATSRYVGDIMTYYSAIDCRIRDKFYLVYFCVYESINSGIEVAFWDGDHINQKFDTESFINFLIKHS